MFANGNEESVNNLFDSNKRSESLRKVVSQSRTKPQSAFQFLALGHSSNEMIELWMEDIFINSEYCLFPENAEELSEIIGFVIDISEKINSNHSLSRAHFYMGKIAALRNSFKLNEKNLNAETSKVEDIFNERLGAIELRTGQIKFSFKMYEEAFVYLNRAMQRFDRLQNKFKEIETRASLAGIFLELNNLDRAEQEFDAVFNLANEINNNAFLCLSFMSKSKIYLKRKDYTLAAAYAELALKKSLTLGFSFLQAEIFLSIARIKKEAGEIKSAERLYLRAIEEFLDFGFTEKYADVCYELGVLYLQNNIGRNAKYYIEEAISYKEREGKTLETEEIRRELEKYNIN